MSGFILCEEKSCCHVKIISAAVVGIFLCDLCLEGLSICTACGNGLKLFKIIYLCLSVLEILGSVVRSKYKVILLCDVAFQLSDYCICVTWETAFW